MPTPPTHDPLDYIRTLQQTITGSSNYGLGFPILKELLQNAEDSQASHFDYGYYPGIKDSEHSLLQCPGVFTLSNGFFGIKNAIKIAAAIGGSTKISEEDSIGKFGLGLKSIFNLCEAFFYISDQPSYQNSYDEYNGFNFFNPWSVQGKDKFHKNWPPAGESDRNAIQSYFKFLLDKQEYKKSSKNWLLLLIPLRQRIHKPDFEFDIDGNSISYIREQYFEVEPDFLSSVDTQNKFSQILPMLASVECIRFWQSQTKKITFEINISNSNGKRTRKLSETPSCHSWSGHIVINQYDQPAPQKNLYFWGIENLVNDKLDPQSELKDFGKLQPHIAIVISRQDSSSSQLVIQPAVFLPIGNPIEELKIQLNQSYQITIHGCFKPNSTRTAIQGLFTDKGELLQWNQDLYNNVLPLLLNALNNLSKMANVTVDEINDICQVIRETKLFKEDQSKILKNTDFLCTVTNNCTLIKWQLIDSTEKILGISFFINELGNIFPGLIQLSQIAKIIDKSKANLILKKERLDWSSDQILLLVESIDIEALRQNLKSFDFLQDILQENKSSLTCEIQQSLVLVLQSIFCNTTTQEIQQKAAELITFLDSHQWISLNVDDQILTAIYKVEDLEILVVSEKIKKNNQNKLTSAESAYSIFQAILSNGLSSKIESVLYTILGMIVENKSCFIGKIKTIKFIQGFELSHGNKSEDAYYSIEDIETHPKVFLKSEESTIIAEKLVQSIESFTILMIKPKVAKWVNPELKDCDRRACLDILSSKSFKLSTNPENRQPLLEELVK